MPNQNLSDAEIDAVLAYIGKESEQAPVAAAPTAPAPEQLHLKKITLLCIGC